LRPESLHGGRILGKGLANPFTCDFRPAPGPQGTVTHGFHADPCALPEIPNPEHLMLTVHQSLFHQADVGLNPIPRFFTLLPHGLRKLLAKDPHFPPSQVLSLSTPI